MFLVCYNGAMRIIAGKFKGKVLSEFKLASTRPTSDLVREALFDKIGYKIYGSVFLVLFAGTGAVGIEAISRGAQKIYFVDNNKEANNLIKKNISKVDCNNYEIFDYDWEIALNYFFKNNIVFDIVFLDPPYATSFAENAIDIIIRYNLIGKDGLIVWEHDEFKNDYIREFFPTCKTKKYGKKFLTYIE